MERGIKAVLIPGENEKDIPDIPQQMLKSVSLIKVDHMDQVLRHALVLSDLDLFFKPRDAAAIDGRPPLA